LAEIAALGAAPLGPGRKMVNGGEGAGLRNRNGLHYLGGDSEVQNMVRRYVDTYDATPSPSIASPRPPMGAIRGGIAPPRVVSMKDESGNKVKLGTRFRSRLSGRPCTLLRG
jgi:hypothetical protein